MIKVHEPILARESDNYIIRLTYKDHFWKFQVPYKDFKSSSLREKMDLIHKNIKLFKKELKTIGIISN